MSKRRIPNFTSKTEENRYRKEWKEADKAINAGKKREANRLNEQEKNNKYIYEMKGRMQEVRDAQELRKAEKESEEYARELYRKEKREKKEFIDNEKARVKELLEEDPNHPDVLKADVVYEQAKKLYVR